MLWPFSSKNSRLAVAVLQFVSHLFPHITPFPNQETREPQGEAHHHRHREEGKHKEPASLFPGIGKYQDSRSWGLLQNMDHLPGSFECYGGKKFTNPPLKSSKIIKTLLGGFNPSEKYKSNGMIIPNIWKNTKCSKPPSRNHSKSSSGKPLVVHIFLLKAANPQPLVVTGSKSRQGTRWGSHLLSIYI